MRTEQYVLYVDGGSRGNGTADAQGYGSWELRVPLLLDRSRDGKGLFVARHSFEFKQPCTNNEAEYMSLEWALRKIGSLPRHAHVTVRMDSKLVLDQVSGAARLRAEHLRPRLEDVLEQLIILRGFGYHVVLEKAPREEIVAVLGH